MARVLPVEDQRRLHADLARVYCLIATGAPLAPVERLQPGAPIEITSGPLAGTFHFAKHGAQRQGSKQIQETWQTLPISAGYVNSARGFGLEDLANTPAGHEPRAGGQLAFHVLEVMESLLVSADAGQAVVIDSRCARPSLVPLS